MRLRGVALALLLASPALSQQDDRSYLTAFLEDNLSGAGRQVVVTGFTGALSSKASIERLTIADDTGIWLTLDGVVLDWNRASLLRGRVSVNTLSAQVITFDRVPQATPASALPAPEAGGFSLPELPVSVEIGAVLADSIVLGPTVLGQPVEGRLEASLTLAGGEGRSTLFLGRTDAGPDGSVTLTASYSNASQQLVIDLAAAEAAGGIAASLLGLPGNPAAELVVKGAGPLADFTADVRLATDGVDRLSGAVTLRGMENGAQGFAADLSGDLAPLFLPEYAEFFGNDIALQARGFRAESGRLQLDRLALNTRALALEGALALAADGLPESFAVKAQLGLPGGGAVLLPLPGVATRVDGALLDLSYDAARGEGWAGTAVLNGLNRSDLAADRLSLTGSGRIERMPGGDVVGATLSFDGAGLRPADAGLAQALGPAVSGSATLFWKDGQGALAVPRLALRGAGYALSGQLRIEGLDAALRTSGRIEARTDDLARFSGMAGRPLGGAGVVVVEGSGSRLAGDFDLTGYAEGRDLRVGIAQVDRVLQGLSRVDVSVRRDATGTLLREARLAADGLSAIAKGQLASAGSQLTASIDLPSLARLDPAYRGALALSASFDGTPVNGRITLDGKGTGLAIGRAEADRLLAGSSAVTASLALRDGQVQIDEARLANPQVTVSATGRVTGALREVALNARLANLALLIPEFPGAVTVAGTAVQDAGGYRLDLRGAGPGQIDARVAGRVAANLGSADLTIAGTAQAGLANPFLDPRAVSGPLRFDLALKGRPALASLSGRVSLSGGRITDPGLALAFERTEAVADLSGGVARLAGTTQLAGGGRIRLDGTVGLAVPFAADLGLHLDTLRLRDPSLYETSASGSVRVTGPLTGGARISGQIALGETELRLSTAAFGGIGGLPGLQHQNEPAAVRATRVRAGLLDIAEASRSGAARPFGLDLVISAPSRVFIRGRGLDAELGGTLRLGGTSAAVLPSGGFELVRGRLDILGKRLVLSEATLELEGDFIPIVAIAASNSSDGITSFVRIDGPASEPEVSFTSSPELPEEEVVSRLLFGRGLDKISALQAAQLASAVAALAGRGGDGLVGNLRKNFGLDDLDVSTAEDGSAVVKAGKYVSENVYTELELGQQDNTQINLNLDIRPGVTVKGRVSADGETGLGIFLQRDY